MTSPTQPTDAQLMAAFVNVLTVEKIEQDFFRGIATPQGRGRSFGGQVIAQAVSAATMTVPEDRPVHSLHAYFMRPGDATQPVLYQVERDRDGGSFTTRRVVAIQHGQPILNLAASFHVHEAGLFHADTMPDVAMPEELLTEEQLVAASDVAMSDMYRKWIATPRPIEMRPVTLRPPIDRTLRPAVQNMWFRTKGPLGDNRALQRAALAFVSDFGLLGTSMMPHGRAFADPDMQFASLDHALWIHDDFRLDDWLLYAMDSPWAGGARGFNRGRIFTRDGRLVANTTQEGLVRQVTPRS